MCWNSCSLAASVAGVPSVDFYRGAFRKVLETLWISPHCPVLCQECGAYPGCLGRFSPDCLLPPVVYPTAFYFRTPLQQRNISLAPQDAVALLQHQFG